MATPAALSELPPKSAGHHTNITPIFRARTVRQERFKSSAELTQASSQEHGSPNAPTYSCQYLSPPLTVETMAAQPGPASWGLTFGPPAKSSTGATDAKQR